MKIFTIKQNKFLQNLMITCFWIGVWGLLSLIKNNELILPSPVSTIKALLSLVQEGFFWNSLFFSIYRVFVGFLLSLIIGLILGLICGFNGPLHRLLVPIVAAMKSTPVISIIVIALLWFRSTNVPIFVAFLMCFPITWTNTVEGIKHVDHKLLEMAKIYSVQPSNIIKKVYIPSLKPYIIAAIKNTIGLSWKVTVAAEVLSSPKHSIGYNLYSAKAYLESSKVFAWTAVIILLSFTFEYLIKSILEKVGNQS